MDIGNFFNSLVGNVERTILDPSTIITDNVTKLNSSFAANSKLMTTAIGDNLQNIAGSKEKGLAGLLNSTVNNINPMFLAVAGIGAAGFLILMLKI